VFVWKVSCLVYSPPFLPLPLHSHSLPINEQDMDCSWIEQDINRSDDDHMKHCCTEPPEPLDVNDFDCLCAAMIGDSARTDRANLDYEKHLSDGSRVNTCGGALAGKVADYVGGLDFVREESTTCEQVATKLAEFEPFCGQQINFDGAQDADGNMPFYWDMTMKDASTNKCATNADKDSCESAQWTVELSCDVLEPSCNQKSDECDFNGDVDVKAWMAANDGVDIIGNPQTCWDRPSSACEDADVDIFDGHICAWSRWGEWSGDSCFDNTYITSYDEEAACRARKKSQVSFHPIGKTSCLFGS
jgi:hypothetical protein